MDIPYCLLFIGNVAINMCCTVWSANKVIDEVFCSFTEHKQLNRFVFRAKIWEIEQQTNKDKATKRTLLIMMIRTQVPLTIDVGPFIRMHAAATLTVLLTSKVIYLFIIGIFIAGFQGNYTVTPLLWAKSGTKPPTINFKATTK